MTDISRFSQLDELVELMDRLKLTDEQKFQLYFMTYDDRDFVREFIRECSDLEPNDHRVRQLLDMVRYDIETVSRPVYEKFRKEARYYLPYKDRTVGVIENYEINVLKKKDTGTVSRPKRIKIRK